MSKRLRNRKPARRKILDWSDILVNKEMDNMEGICIGYYKDPCEITVGVGIREDVYIRVFHFVKGEHRSEWNDYNPKNKLEWMDEFVDSDPGSLEPLDDEYLKSFLNNGEFEIIWNDDLKIGAPIKEEYLKRKISI